MLPSLEVASCGRERLRPRGIHKDYVALVQAGDVQAVDDAPHADRSGKIHQLSDAVRDGYTLTPKIAGVDDVAVGADNQAPETLFLADGQEARAGTVGVATTAAAPRRLHGTMPYWRGCSGKAGCRPPPPWSETGR